MHVKELKSCVASILRYRDKEAHLRLSRVSP
jgi:hypothetical protein